MLIQENKVTSANAKLHTQIAGKGAPILVLHGGPGGKCHVDHFKYFDLRKHKVILFDQRGCGNSTGTLASNTTSQLISDITAILDYYTIHTTNIFGGSWGSTLALLYAFAFPNRVSSIVAYGLFLARKKDTAYADSQLKKQYAQTYALLLQQIPKSQHSNVQQYLAHQVMQGNKQAAQLLFMFEARLAKTVMTQEQIILASKNITPKDMRVFAHYLVHDFFVSDNYILCNAHKINHIPVRIVHAKYDRVCPVQAVYDLQKRLPTMHTTIVEETEHGGRVLHKQLKHAISCLF